MIRDKKSCIYDKDACQVGTGQNEGGDDGVSKVPVEFEQTPLIGIFNAVRNILKDIKTDPGNEACLPYFRTVRYNIGQMGRITSHKINTEGAIGFPAAFIHFIDIQFLVGSARIGEGTGKMRIKFVLNRLNNQDEGFQTEGLAVYRMIKSAINERIGEISKYATDCRLTYFDPVENADDGVQEYWMTYEIRFMDYTDYYYKDYIDRYFVIPPFTNHSDQKEGVKPKDHGDHEEDFDEASGFKTTWK